MNSTQDWKRNFTKFLENRGKTQQLAELTAVQSMRALAAENQRNSEAEAAYVRRKAWDEQRKPEDEQSSDMGHTILGDITTPPTVVVTGQQQSSVWPMAALVLASLLPVAGIGAAGAGAVAAYLLTRQPPNEQQPDPNFEDSSVSIGLGKLEDYTK